MGFDDSKSTLWKALNSCTTSRKITDESQQLFPHPKKKMIVSYIEEYNNNSILQRLWIN